MRLVVRGLADPEVSGQDRLEDWRRNGDGDGDGGVDHVRPLIFAPNHHSHLDTALMVRSVPFTWRRKLVVAAAADYFFDKRWKAVLAALSLNAIPIDRESTGRRSADLIRDLVADGWSLVIYPEGGRSPDGWGQDFKGGAAYVSNRTGAPVVPVFIDGTGSIFGKGMNRPKPGRTRVVFGAPMAPARGRVDTPVQHPHPRPPSPRWPTSRRRTGGRPASGRRRARARSSADPTTPDGAGSGTCRSAAARASPAGAARRRGGGPSSDARRTRAIRVRDANGCRNIGARASPATAAPVWWPGGRDTPSGRSSWRSTHVKHHPTGTRRVIAAGLATGLGALLALATVTPASAARGHEGQVYAISNDPAGNALLVFDRAGDGALTAAAPMPTGGTGTGSGLGSQGSVAVSDRGDVVLAVNPGSDDVALFVEHDDELVLVDTEPSGGDLPTSVAVDGRNVYVLNAGVDNNISGFRIGRDGLDPVDGSTQPLSAPDAGGAAGRLHTGRPAPRRHRAVHQPDRHVPRPSWRGRAGRRLRLDRRHPVRLRLRPRRRAARLQRQRRRAREAVPSPATPSVGTARCRPSTDRMRPTRRRPAGSSWRAATPSPPTPAVAR